MIRREPIAIVGIAAIFPGSKQDSADTAGFWNDIVNGRDLLTGVPPHYWRIEDYYDPDPAAPDKTYGRRGAFLSPIEFDTLEFGLPPAALPATDSSQLLALLGAKRVLADAANGRAEHVPKDRIGVFLGAAATTSAAMNMAGRLNRPAWIKGMREAGIPESQVQAACDRIAACFTPLQENTFPGLLSNVIAGRVANRFDLGGSNFTTDAACASSLAAVSVAINDLYLGNADMVLAGGVDTLNDIMMFTCFSKTPALSPSEDCRPFAKNADGTMLGEGLAMFALRRLADAERDGDKIYALIRGLGSSSDGLAKSVYAPRPAGQAMALRRAYEAAGYGPETVELVEAHGTATAAGDQAEFEALRQVFRAGDPVRRQWCALGSVKSQIGHTKGAAGAAGLFKAAMALHHKMLPPTIKVDRPNPAMALEESPFYLNTEARPWIRGGSSPRRASVSSFGFGGTNFHVALEEYRGSGAPAPRLSESPVELALIGAPDADAATRECQRMAAMLAGAGEDAWRRTVRESQRAFDPSNRVRLAVVASARADCEAKLARAMVALQKSPDEAIRDSDGVYYDPRAASGPVAFLFSGQGSQYPGMGSGLASVFDAAREAWDLAEEIVSTDGFSLRDAVFPHSMFDESDREKREEFLRRTDVAQPALAAASLAQLALLDKLGVVPDFAAGHSFGELVALHAAGCFSATDLLRIARKRGELMAGDSAAGTMTAVSHPIDDLRDFLNQPGSNGIVIANHNSPRQSVLSGKIASMEAAERRLAAASISFRRLPVGGAFHSPLMSGAVEPFSRYLADFAVESPSLPVYSNADAAVYPRDPVLIRERIALNLTKPVRFADEIGAIYGAGARVFVEVGAGSVLRQLTSQCLRGRPHLAIALSQKGRHDVSSLWHAVGQLAVAGVNVRCEQLWPAFHAVPTEAPAPRSLSTVLIDGAGYNRPYPPKAGSAALPGPNPEPVPAPAAPIRIATSPVAPPAAAHSGSAFELIQAQIGEAQRASQAAILESLSLTLKSLEAVASELSGGATPREFQIAPAPQVQAVVLPSAPSTPVEPTRPASLPSKPAAFDPGAILLQIVAEKTGYPQDVLTLDVELEAGLGIDSIKRVEIFSAIQQQLPDLPEVTPAVMGQLKTLRDILAFLGEKPAPAAKPEPAASAVNMERALLEIVAEKTGYPIEILNLDVELEAGLGIDSIKRVEIFSAIQHKIAGVPEFKPEDAGRLRTLRDILAFAGAAPAASRTGPLRRSEVRLIESQGCGLPCPGLFTCGKIAVFDGGSGLAQAVVDRLEKLSIPAHSASTLDGCRAAIYLGGWRAFQDAQEALDVNQEAFEIAHSLACGAEPPALFVTVQNNAGDYGGWAAGIAGIAKTFAREWPASAVKTMDLEAGTADTVVTELLSGGADLEVTLRADGSRLVPVLYPSEIAAGGVERIGPDSVLVASGGARGVTAACLIELARTARPRIALLGRTPLEDEPADCRDARDEAELKRAISRRGGRSGDLKEISREAARILAAREIRDTLRALDQAGSPCAYFSADMRDPASVERAVALAREQFGPITAIVHGAGVIADKKIADKTPDQFALVFDTKARGLAALLTATQSDPISTICLFSSVAARFGNPGQCDYAAANEVLNKIGVQEARRRNDCLVRSIGWGPWDGGMVTPALAAHFRSRGAELIPLESGAHAFVQELRHATGGTEILIAAGGDFIAETETATEVLVNRATYPFLDSHRIREHAVLPVVLVNEWFHRLAESRLPGMRVVSCRDLRVYRGVPLPAFDAEGHLLRLLSKPAGPNEVHCELRSLDGTLHYSASLELQENGDSEEGAPGVPEARPVSDIYRANGDLFHGPDFQVIDQLLNLDESGVTGILHTTRDMGWPSGPWKTDAAAMDGVLQLIRLWGVRHLGGPSLPTRIGSFARHIPGVAPSPLRCEIQARASGSLGIVADARLLLRDGRIFAEMREIEMHLTPGS